MPKTKSSSSSSSSAGKVFGGRIPENLAKAIRIMGIEENKSVQEIMIEALHDILSKYGKKVPKE